MSQPRSNVRRSAAPVTYPTAARVTAHVALVLGCSEDSAHQALYGEGARRLSTRTALTITGIIRSGDRAALAHFAAPIEAALKGISAPAESAQLSEQAQVADGDEDAAGVRYYRHPSEANARAYVLALDTDRALNLEERQAVAARWGIA